MAPLGRVERAEMSRGLMDMSGKIVRALRIRRVRSRAWTCVVGRPGAGRNAFRSAEGGACQERSDSTRATRQRAG